jgi:3-oxoacyl-[acyl-carrier protein] reductase
MFDGKVAIVTGSGCEIGRATDELLNVGGAKVVIDDLDPEVAGQAASELGGETAVRAAITLTGGDTR